MWLEFFLQNVHFALGLFAGLVFFAIFWLYYDAWSERGLRRGLLHLAGLLLLALSFVAEAPQFAVASETALLNLLPWLVAMLRVAGYILVIIYFWRDPLPQRPTTTTPAAAGWYVGLSMTAALPMVAVATTLSYPILAATAWLLLRRRAIRGLEQHLLAESRGFLWLALAHLTGATSLLAGTTNVFVYRLVAPFGPLWMISHVFLLLAIVTLGRWVWQYLLKRPQPQVFMVLITVILLAFLLMTVSFTGLLLNSGRREALAQLATNVKVLGYTLQSKQGEALSDAQVLAQSPQVQGAVSETNLAELAASAERFLVSKEESFLVITDAAGKVLARGEDAEAVGGSLSNDTVLSKALRGQATTSLAVRAGPLVPEVSVRAAAPIVRDGVTIGAVMTGMLIDPAFVDGLKQSTGLEAAIFGERTLVASTLPLAEAKAGWLGTRESNEEIANQVLGRGESFQGAIRLFTVPALAAYEPLRDADGAPVGMMLVSKTEASVLAAAQQSISLTFIATALLLVLAVIPSYFLSKYLEYQLR